MNRRDIDRSNTCTEDKREQCMYKNRQRDSNTQKRERATDAEGR